MAERKASKTVPASKPPRNAVALPGITPPGAAKPPSSTAAQGTAGAPAAPVARRGSTATATRTLVPHPLPHSNTTTARQAAPGLRPRVQQRPAPATAAASAGTAAHAPAHHTAPASSSAPPATTSAAVAAAAETAEKPSPPPPTKKPPQPPPASAKPVVPASLRPAPPPPSAKPQPAALQQQHHEKEAPKPSEVPAAEQQQQQQEKPQADKQEPPATEAPERVAEDLHGDVAEKQQDAAVEVPQQQPQEPQETHETQCDTKVAADEEMKSESDAKQTKEKEGEHNEERAECHEGGAEEKVDEKEAQTTPTRDRQKRKGSIFTRPIRSLRRGKLGGEGEEEAEQQQQEQPSSSSSNDSSAITAAAAAVTAAAETTSEMPNSAREEPPAIEPKRKSASKLAQIFRRGQSDSDKAQEDHKKEEPKAAAPHTPAVAPAAPPESSGENAAPPTPKAAAAPTAQTTEEKNARRRALVLNEIITTEESYVADLDALEGVIGRIRERKLLDEDKINSLFPGISIIRQLNAVLLQELKAGKPVGKSFARLAGFMKMYIAYCVNVPKAEELLRQLAKSSNALRSFLNDVPSLPGMHQLGISDFLIKPVQRLCRYPLLLRELLKLTPEDHADYEEIKKAMNELSKTLDAVNERKRTDEQYDKVVQLAQQLDIEDKSTFITPSRRFVKEAVLRELQPSGAVVETQYDFFNDLVLRVKPAAHQSSKLVLRSYIERAMLLVSSVDNAAEVRRLPASKGPVFLFDIIHVGVDKYTIVCDSDAERQAWIELCETIMERRRPHDTPATPALSPAHEPPLTRRAGRPPAEQFGLAPKHKELPPVPPPDSDDSAFVLLPLRCAALRDDGVRFVRFARADTAWDALLARIARKLGLALDTALALHTAQGAPLRTMDDLLATALPSTAATTAATTLPAVVVTLPAPSTPSS